MKKSTRFEKIYLGIVFFADVSAGGSCDHFFL